MRTIRSAVSCAARSRYQTSAPPGLSSPQFIRRSQLIATLGAALSIVCGRPVGCKGFFVWVGAVVRLLRVSGLVMRPFTRRGPVWEVCEPGPNRHCALEALRLTLVFPAPSH